MIRLLIAVLTVLLFADAASACGRCGRFGGGCHFTPHVVHHAPPVIVPPSVNNFIFNNSYPGPILPPGGASLFGYSLSAQGQYIDPAMVIDRAGRIAELAQQNAKGGVEMFNSASVNALALNDQFNQRANTTAIASVAISALHANVTPAPQATALKVSVSSTGETTTEWLPADDKPVEFKLQGADISLSCGKCHNKAGEAPGGFFFDGKGMTREEFDWAAESVWAGKMPKNSKLNRADKSAVVEKLRQLVK